MFLINTGKLFYNSRYAYLPQSYGDISRLISYAELTEHVPGIQTYKDFSFYFDQNVALIDRSNTLKMLFVHDNGFFKLPNITKPKTFTGCCEERAHHIVNNSNHFYFLYGGGIDSIVAFDSLSRLTKNITVITTQTTIDGDVYYKKNISGKYQVDHLMNISKFDGVFVTGHLGDELFGTSVYNSLYIRNKNIFFEKPTKDNLIQVFKKREFMFAEEEDTLNHIIQLMYQIAEKSPIDLNTTHKFIWWLNFCLLWNVSYSRFMAFKQLVPEETYFPFFSTEDFQNWSINNIDNTFIDKKPAKDYLGLDYIQDMCKQKRNKDHFFGMPMAYVITNDHKNIYDEEVLSTVSIDDENSFIKESSL